VKRRTDSSILLSASDSTTTTKTLPSCSWMWRGAVVLS